MQLFMSWNKNLSTSMNEFQESGINFRFNPDWTVFKYDENTAHKKVEKCLKPTKAVDFLGIHDNRLYFVEVKNYRKHTNDGSTREVLRDSGEELMRRIAIKVRDTIATSTSSARFSTNDRDFFTQVNQLLLNDEKKVTVIACVEFDASNEMERKVKMSIWQNKLKQKLSWLHASKISVNSADNITNIMPDLSASLI